MAKLRGIVVFIDTTFFQGLSDYTGTCPAGTKVTTGDNIRYKGKTYFVSSQSYKYVCQKEILLFRMQRIMYYFVVTDNPFHEKQTHLSFLPVRLPVLMRIATAIRPNHANLL
jgi:hypothetical protein